jgi:hypothetical protein
MLIVEGKENLSTMEKMVLNGLIALLNNPEQPEGDVDTGG